MTDATVGLENTGQSSRGDYYGALLLGLCMFFTGGAGLVVEYVVATATTFILGSSIIVWSLVIGIMLGAMGVSGWIQERIGDRYLLEKFFAIEVTLAIAGGFAPIGLYWAYGAMPDHFNLVLYGWVILIGLLVGLEIPVVMRIINQRGITLPSNLKLVFGADYLGAMVFMFVWVFYLLPNYPITEISFIVSGLNFLVALSAVMYFARRGDFKSGPLVMIVALFAIGVTGYGYMNNRSWNVYLEQRLYDDPVVYDTTTQYQHLVITHAANRCENGDAETRLYINGNTQFGSCDEHVYHDNLVHPVMTLTAAEHPRVLILGGGDGLAARDVVGYDPQSLTLVDLDPQMVEIARDNEYLAVLNEGVFGNSVVLTPETLGVSQDAGLFDTVDIGTGAYDSAGTEVSVRAASVRRMHIDAGRFLQTAAGVYDAVIVDLPDPSSVELSRLYTTLFYRQLRSRLAHDGLVVVQSTSPIHAREVFLEIGRTMEAAGFEVIPYHDNVSSFGEWGWYLACLGQGCEARLREQIATLDAFAVDTNYLTPDRFRANLSFGNVNGVPFEESAQSDRINTMTDPTMFMRYEGAWKHY